MPRPLLAMLCGILLMLALCACGTPGIPLDGRIPTDCTRPAAPQLLYPMNGAVGVPDGNFTMVFAFTVAPSIWGSPSVSAPNGAVNDYPAVGPLQPAPSPLPTPIATPPSGATLQGVTIGPLLPGKTYNVWFYYVPPQQCIPPGGGTLAITPVGSFTTK